MSLRIPNFLTLCVALSACAPQPIEAEFSAPSEGRGASAKADEAGPTEPPLECGELEVGPAPEEVASFGGLADALGEMIEAQGDDCEVFTEWAEAAELEEPEAVPEEEPEPELEIDPREDEAYERFAARLEWLADDPLANAVALQLASAMFGTDDLEDSEYEGLFEDPLAEYGDLLELEDIPLDEEEEIIETELSPEFVEWAQAQPEPEPEGEEADEFGVRAHALEGKCGKPESFWPPSSNQPSEYARGSALAVVVYLNRPSSGFFGMSGGPFGSRERQRVRNTVRTSHAIWRTAARDFGGKLRFRMVEAAVNMHHIGSDSARWTENQMVYNTIESLGGLAGRNLKKEPWGSYKPSKRHADLGLLADRMRKAFGTDHAYFIFAVDSGYQATPTFRTGHGAYAYTNGGMMFVNFTAWGLGINEYAVSHETGHVFGALDHYKQAGVGCRERGGYRGVATTIQEDGDSRRNEGCTGSQRDIMDRFSRVWWYWTTHGGQTPFTRVTAGQTGLDKVDERPRLEMTVAGAWRFSSFFGSTQPVNLYAVHYKTEIGTIERHRAVSGKRHLSPTRLDTIEHEYEAGSGRLEPVRLRAGSRTQVQCGALLQYKWGAPPSRLRMRVYDKLARGTCAEISNPRRGSKATGQPGCPW